MNKKVFPNRKQALRFGKKVNGTVSWFQEVGSIKKKDRFTGRIKSRPALITKYKVTY